MKRKQQITDFYARKKPMVQKSNTSSFSFGSFGIRASAKRRTTRASYNKDEPSRDGSGHSSSSLDRFQIDYPGQHKSRHDEGAFSIFNAYSGLKVTTLTGNIGMSPQYEIDLAAAVQNTVLIPPLFTLESMLDVKQSSTTLPTVTANTMFQSRTAVGASATIFEIDQNTDLDGSHILPLTTGTEQQNQGFQRVLHLKDVQDTVMFTNFSNVGCRIKVVWYMCKNNCSKLPIELMDESVTNRRPTGTFNIFQRGGGSVLPQPGFGFPNFVGSLGTNVLDARNFPLANKYWKPLKVKHFVLEAGDNHELVYTVNVKKYVQKENLVQAYTPSGSISQGAVDNLYFKGLTVIPTVFIIPNNVAEETNATTTMSRVTPGPFSVGATCYRKYRIGFVNKKVNNQMQYLNNTLAQTVVSSSTRLYDIEDDDVAVDITLTT